MSTTAEGGERDFVNIMTTDHGQIVLAVPERITSADLADFEAWIALVTRTMRRRALADAPALEEGGE